MGGGALGGWTKQLNRHDMAILDTTSSLGDMVRGNYTELWRGKTPTSFFLERHLAVIYLVCFGDSEKI